MNTLGIDFGTSNCTAYVATDAGKLISVPLEGAAALLPSVAFTARRDMAEEVLDLHGTLADSFITTPNGQVILFGNPALQAYMSDPLSGTLVKSPKAFLGSDLPETQLKAFRDVIAYMLGHIKQKAEQLVKGEVSAAVIGRPINYHGIQGETGNNQALDVMRAAATTAGFGEIEFFMEPVAAALAYEKSVRKETRVLVVDIGGGTTDCAMVRVGPELARKQYRDDDVLGSSGDRVGGTDFDQALAWHSCMPLLGCQGQTKAGRPIPFSMFIDAISTRSVPAQQRFRGAATSIKSLIRDAVHPEQIARLLAVHDGQLQYRLIHSAEQAKIGLSTLKGDKDVHKVSLDYLEAGLGFGVTPADFIQANADWLAKIQSLIAEALKSAGTQPDTIFITGGMGMSPAVQACARKVLGKDALIESGDMLGSVGHGLGVCAGQRWNFVQH